MMKVFGLQLRNTENEGKCKAETKPGQLKKTGIMREQSNEEEVCA